MRSTRRPSWNVVAIAAGVAAVLLLTGAEGALPSSGAVGETSARANGNKKPPGGAAGAGAKLSSQKSATKREGDAHRDTVSGSTLSPSASKAGKTDRAAGAAAGAAGNAKADVVTHVKPEVTVAPAKPVGEHAKTSTPKNVAANVAVAASEKPPLTRATETHTVSPAQNDRVAPVAPAAAAAPAEIASYPVPDVPVHAPQPATNDPLELARRAQDRADNVGRDLSSAQNKVRDIYRAHVARATAYRNRLLSRVPHFWYDALLGLPRYDHFLTVPSNESPESLAALASVSAASEDGYEDPGAKAVRAWEQSQETSLSATPAADMTHPNNVDDHYILRHFLEEVSCHLVDGKSDLERSELDRLVEAGIDGDGVPKDIATSHATKQEVHGRRSSQRYVEVQSAITEEMYRVILRFKRNPYFADRVLYKQLPASHAHMLSTSDEDVLASEGRDATLGHGNSISWSTKRTRVAHLKDYTRSIFGIFDDAYYSASDTDTRASLRMRAAGLVSSVCTYLDPNPLPYWERRDAERSAVIDRLKSLYAHPNEHYRPPAYGLYSDDSDADEL